MKRLLKRNKSEKKLPARITNDTVAQHREKVLAAGRKHKYPVQYTRHRLVWVTAIVSVVVLIIAIGLMWLQLYVWKDTSDLAYRITKIIPLPVASIDGENALYSDYLLYHRSTMGVLHSQGQADQQDKVKFYQRQSIDKALEVAYVRKLARENNLSVDDARVQELIKQQREASKLSEKAYESVVQDNLHWSMDELSTVMKYTLLKQDVSFAIDKNANDLVEKIKQEIAAGKTLPEITQAHEGKVQAVFDIAVSEDNSDGGLTKAAMKLTPGKISDATKTLAGDGYYFIVLSAVDNGTVTYSYVQVPLTAFDKQLNDLKEGNKVNYLISVEKD